MATNFVELISSAREPWRAHAACKEADPDDFFIGPGVSPCAALAMCGRCEVRNECLQYAIDNEEDYGIWGGLNADQRKRLRRRPDNDERSQPDPSEDRAGSNPLEPAALLAAAAPHQLVGR